MDKNIRLLKESCVLIDKKYKGALPIQSGQMNVVPNQTPFFLLIQSQLIRAALDIQVTQNSLQSNPIHQELSNNSLNFIWDAFPPKYIITNTNPVENDAHARDSMKKLLDYTKLYTEIGAIGVNYELSCDYHWYEGHKKNFLNNEIAKEATGINCNIKISN
jgi:hypothetical protein